MKNVKMEKICTSDLVLASNTFWNTNDEQKHGPFQTRARVSHNHQQNVILIHYNWLL